MFGNGWGLGKILVEHKELVHRQQFYFWKNYRNNPLKHILPRSLPEPSATSTVPAPVLTPARAPISALPPVPATSVDATTAPTKLLLLCHTVCPLTLV
ncbi:mediator of RNA polymerase II transcription subunit 31 [Vigna unguiculata]|nr:mediator of RNA polymerase II transcription subunit 31 [Vigna unguiculata]